MPMTPLAHLAARLGLLPAQPTGGAVLRPPSPLPRTGGGREVRPWRATTPGLRLGAAVLGLVVVAGCGSDPGAQQQVAGAAASSSPAAPAAETPGPAARVSATPAAGSAQVVELGYRAGRVSGAAGRVEIALGSDVVLRVTSDVADELHLHGYDEKADLAAGTPGELRFRADIPGIFELELEQAGKQLTRLTVR